MDFEASFVALRELEPSKWSAIHLDRITFSRDRSIYIDRRKRIEDV